MSTEYTEAERIINAGIEIELTKVGKVTVRELSLENLIKLSNDLVVLFRVLQSSVNRTGRKTEEASNEVTFISALLASAELVPILKKVAAGTTGKTVSDFNELGLADWLRWAAAFKKVMNWREIKELFFQIVPEESLNAIFQRNQV